MKKLYIAFILLFGFLTFVPQIALGDLIGHKQVRRKSEEIIALQEKEWKCLNKKKSKLPEKYNGPSLKVENVPCRAPIIHSNARPENNTYTQTMATKWLDYKQNNYFYTLEKEDGKVNNQLSCIANCKEYIVIGIQQDNWRRVIGVDVTDVPAGSHLKYMPGIKEVQVFPPTEEFKAEQKKNILNDKRKKLKNILIGIALLIVIILKIVIKK